MPFVGSRRRRTRSRGSGHSTWFAPNALATVGADTALATLAAGTGNDFAKSSGTPVHDFAAMAERVARGETRRVDVGRLNTRPFVNAAGFGFDVAVLDRMTRERLALKHFAKAHDVAGGFLGAAGVSRGARRERGFERRAYSLGFEGTKPFDR